MQGSTSRPSQIDNREPKNLTVPHQPDKVERSTNVALGTTVRFTEDPQSFKIILLAKHPQLGLK